MKTYDDLLADLNKLKQPSSTQADFNQWRKDFDDFNAWWPEAPTKIRSLFDTYAALQDKKRTASRQAAADGEDLDPELAAAFKASLASEAERKRGGTPPNETQVSPPETLTSAMDYKAPKLIAAFQALEKTYPGFRGMRGDGNCYYRAVIYGLIEQMVLSPNRAELFGQLIARVEALRVETLQGTLKQPIARIEAQLDMQRGEYHEGVSALITTLQQAASNQIWQTREALEADMRDPDSKTDKLLVRTARLFTAQGALAIHHSFFDDDSPNILTMGVDADGPPLEAAVLFKQLGISGTLVRVQMQQGPRQGVCDTRPTEPPEHPLHPPIAVHILLKPGHYDLLYSPEAWQNLHHVERPTPQAAASAAASIEQTQAYKAQVSPTEQIKSTLDKLLEDIKHQPAQAEIAMTAFLEAIEKQPENKTDNLIQAIQQVNECKTRLEINLSPQVQINKAEEISGNLEAKLNDLLLSMP